jgi:hypothetical protein
MTKRAVTAVVWFAAIAVGYEVLWSLTGVPRSVGPIIATAVAAAITIDSPGLFAAGTATRIGDAAGPTTQVSPEG